MKTLFPINKVIKVLQSMMSGDVSINDYITKHSEYLIEEDRMHKEFQEMSKEIHMSLADAKSVITEEKQKTAILICYKSIFSSCMIKLEIDK